MSAVHGIAWGLVEPDELAARFRYWRREVRKELRTHRIQLRPSGLNHYAMTRRDKKAGNRIRIRLGHGDLKRCCEIASKIITPSNPEK